MIAMVVVIEVCQLHTVRNIAGECNLEVFDNQMTNWAARKIIMITGNTFLPVEFVCMHVSVSRQTCTLPPVNDVKVTVYHNFTPILIKIVYAIVQVNCGDGQIRGMQCI